MYTPYDWQQTIAHRADYVEGRLLSGSPVVGLSCEDGVILVTIRNSVRKIFEIYDRLLYGGVGSQADLEMLRISAIDFAHGEGFTRSEDDVTVQRVVGFALSPALKRAFADPTAAPFVARALFAEMGKGPNEDLFFKLDYDGEYAPHHQYAVVGGSPVAEHAALALLAGHEPTAKAGSAVAQALIAWGAARIAQESPDDAHPSLEAATERAQVERETGHVEIGWLERSTPRQSKFSLWPSERIESALRLLQ